MKLTEIIKNGSIMESLENYAIADQFNESETEETTKPAKEPVYDDRRFWRNVIAEPEKFWNMQLLFSNFAFSDWVPRVPGLGFTRAAKIISYQLRNVEPLNYEQRIYRPSDKSGFVMSGTGSLKLPPDYAGYQLTCITSSGSSSQGVPVLVSPEVMAYHQLKNGDLLTSIHGTWQKMTIDWAQHFAITDGLPRGYLVVRRPDQLKKGYQMVNFYYDPYSIMEYEQHGILKWDYVFCNVEVIGEKQQQSIQTFFNNYRQIEGINGRYLTNPDVGEPLFETQYNSPAELKTAYARAQLDFINERMNGTAIEGLKIDELTAKVAAAYGDPFSLRVLSEKCGINASLIAEDIPLKMAIQLVHQAITSKKLLELMQRLLIEQPQMI